jgi:hypothetical protein
LNQDYYVSAWHILYFWANLKPICLIVVTLEIYGQNSLTQKAMKTKEFTASSFKAIVTEETNGVTKEIPPVIKPKGLSSKIIPDVLLDGKIDLQPPAEHVALSARNPWTAWKGSLVAENALYYASDEPPFDLATIYFAPTGGEFPGKLRFNISGLESNADYLAGIQVFSLAGHGSFPNEPKENTYQVKLLPGPVIFAFSGAGGMTLWLRFNHTSPVTYLKDFATIEVTALNTCWDFMEFILWRLGT